MGFCYRQKKLFIGWVVLSLVVFLLLTVLLFCFFTAQRHGAFFILMGWVERIGYTLYTIPQLIKNSQKRCADALSPSFLWLYWITAGCDTVSAWCLNWPAPSRYGAPVAFLFATVLLVQYYYFNWNKTPQRGLYV